MNDQTDEPRRLRMRAPLTQQKQTDLSGLRMAEAADVPALGELMYAAYRGTPDEADAGGSPTEAIREITLTFTGEYGLFVPEASFVAVDHDSGRPCAAALVTLWKDEPLLAYVFTGPQHRGKGLGTKIIKAVMSTLAAGGHTHLSLAVTESNTTAANLYRRLGFTLQTP